jgi:ribose transport system permease protein
MLTSARGLVLVYTQGNPVPITDQRIVDFGLNTVAGTPIVFVAALCVVAIAYGLGAYTPFGRRIRAVGGGEVVAQLSGVNVVRVKIGVMVFAALCAGVSGMVDAARTVAADPATGSGLELTTIAAVVLGGTPLTGGVGSVMGSLFGALTITALVSGLNIVGVSPYAQQVITGAVLVAAVLISIDRRKIGVIK